VYIIRIFLFLPNIVLLLSHCLAYGGRVSNFFLFSRYNNEGSTVDTGLSGVQLMVVTVKLLRDRRLLLLLPLTLWMGVQQVFRGADYTSVSMIIRLLAVPIGFVWSYKRV
jgi:hypothetical protein